MAGSSFGLAVGAQVWVARTRDGADLAHYVPNGRTPEAPHDGALVGWYAIDATSDGVIWHEMPQG
jgi:hypothetical protein